MARIAVTLGCILSALALATTASAFPIIQYGVVLDGPSESPPNASPATGVGQVDVDTSAHTMRVQVSFSGLLGPNSACHIHSATTIAGTGTAGVATTTPTFAGFPTGTTSGTYDNTLDMTQLSSYNPSYVTANGGTAASAEAALFAGIAAGKAYLNIHSQVFGGGEIRGFLVPVPEPATGTLTLCGLAALCLRRRVP